MKKFWSAGLGITLLAATACAPAAAVSDAVDPAVVVTAQGAVRGEADGAVRSFQGIPYAEADRFEAPRPAAGWDGVRDATEPGEPCAQPAGYPIGEYSTEEDCLDLNVTTPAGAEDGLPVIVWIHGGSMMFGMGDLYGPDRLAAGGAVVVSMNYRLGVTSFLTHPDLPESGALALDDQRAALRWVRENIAAFGGDPGNVTVMGQSGGGLGICGHLVSPESEGLFQRAIVQSAPCSAPGAASRDRGTAEAEGAEVIDAVGCADAGDVAACLREVPIGELVEAYGPWREPRPVSGTPALPLPVDEALEAGRFHRVPVLIGVNHDEENGMVLGTELASGAPMADGEYEPAVREAYGDDADAVLRRYPRGDAAGPSLARVRTDSVWSVPTLDTARALSRRTDVRMYEFAERGTPWFAGYDEPSFPADSQHMAELPYIFDLELFQGLTPAQAAFGDRLIGAWTRFAATGDPSGGGEAEWDRLRDDRGPAGWYVQSLDSGEWGRADFAREHGYGFWSRLGG
ncbi:carboxylesterase/lipase family protein [Nocardiopsis changdeensis]|uniref:Carboxylic ester hydrolase n=1 Tax=Nocardiopsis changdeensis TaxID=2831969 RepID=A0ABX8BNC9_9ACTN|nr:MULTISPECIES: carboxylesterase family protein [Nocardiopsis]QUX23118.1 carboxylesterase family protein [Nocardiopsis changdeensis]QYX39063.1 carboxylesterase family protein [Nocardiopsis sp. MT53]